MQNVLTLESKKYAIKIENFEGPLDLLCHLIDKNKMSIYDIKLSDITDQYIEYINQMEQMNLEVTSEFLIMASTLLYIKSKNLLPNEVEDERELTEEELLQRIIEYKKYKEISKKLKEFYDITNIDDFEEIFDIIGKKKGLLQKGGIVDYDRVIDLIINDIKSGKIKNITFDRLDYE